MRREFLQVSRMRNLSDTHLNLQKTSAKIEKVNGFWRNFKMARKAHDVPYWMPAHLYHFSICRPMTNLCMRWVQHELSCFDRFWAISKHLKTHQQLGWFQNGELRYLPASLVLFDIKIYQSTQFGANECKTIDPIVFIDTIDPIIWDISIRIYLTYLHRSLLSKDCRYGPGSTNVQWIDSVSSRASGYWWCITMRHRCWVS